jgi:hypothetical protein
VKAPRGQRAVKAQADRAAAERRLRAAAKKRDAANEALIEAIVDTADIVPRRRAAQLVGRTDARVQQIISEARAKMGGE